MVTDFCQQHIIDGNDVDTNQWKTGLTPSVDLCTYETTVLKTKHHLLILKIYISGH